MSCLTFQVREGEIVVVAIGSPHFVKVSFCVIASVLFKGKRILKSFLASY